VLLIKTLNYEPGTDVGMNENLICVGRKNRKIMKFNGQKRGGLEKKMISDV
jgi:hypothetical protein